MDPIEALVEQFVELRERGTGVDEAEFVRAHPEAGERLAAALAALRQAEALLDAPALPGSIGPYRVLRELGHGGMGRVYEVERDGERLALKWLHEGLARDARTLERFRREGAALAALEHPSIARLHGTGVFAGRPYLVLERVAGTSLAELVARHARERGPGSCVALPGPGTPLERVLALAAALADALAAAHASGVLHRDVTPRNVLVRDDGRPVLIDFGLVHAPEEATLTRTGDLLGTPAYMSPEQARGEHATAASDVYGLGALLRELLTGAPPRASGRTAIAAIRDAAQRPLGPLPRTAVPLPRTVRAVARRATAFHPRWRYPTAAALHADLERCLRGEPVEARAAGLAEQAHELWHARRALVLAGAALGLALLFAATWRARAPDPALLAQRSAAAHARAACAWLDGDSVALAAAADELVAVALEDPFAPLLRALARGELLDASPDPCAGSWLSGERHRRAGRPQQAVDALRAANNVRQGVPLVSAALGLAAWEAGDSAFAQDVLQRAANGLAGACVFHELLATVYTARGLHKDAAHAARAALALAPDAPGPRLLLAHALLDGGDREGALRELAAARARGAEPDALAALAAQLGSQDE